MDDYILMELLKNKGIGEEEFSEKMKKFFTENFARGRGRGRGRSRRDSEGEDFLEDFFSRNNNRDSYNREYNREYNRDYNRDYNREYNREYNRDNYRRDSYRGREMEMFEDFFMNRHNSPQGYMEMEEMGEGSLMEKLRGMGEEQKKRFVEMIMSQGGEEEKGHFNKQYAEYVVSKMYHKENGRKYMGEKYDIHKAKEILERYRGIIPQDVTPADVYVAINDQYHNCYALYKAWFGDNVDGKIIESAVDYWFKDDDYKGGCKIWEYYETMMQ